MGFLATRRRARRALGQPPHATLRLRRAVACTPILCALTALPTAALARDARTGSGGSGGIGVSGGGTTTTPASPTATPAPTATPEPTATPAPIALNVVKLRGVVNATGDGITLTVAASGTQGHPLTIHGLAPLADAGTAIAIESTKPDQVDWSQVATAVIASNGTFVAHWTPARSAQVALRAVLARDPSPTTSTAGTTTTTTSGGSGVTASDSAATAAGEVATSALTIPIFHDAVATMYGPGFWGHHTACGERLTRATLGVASRTLKCGTRVSVYYGGNEITVPVIDRGPYGSAASWDLTMATARALGMTETVTIGTLSPAPPTSVSARA